MARRRCARRPRLRHPDPRPERTCSRTRGVVMTTVENQYLVGNFAPVKDELTVTDLPVEGAIPPEINGRYLRNGPNPIAPEPAAYHWFTGHGMPHAFQLRDR